MEKKRRWIFWPEVLLTVAYINWFIVFVVIFRCLESNSHLVTELSSSQDTAQGNEDQRTWTLGWTSCKATRSFYKTKEDMKIKYMWWQWVKQKHHLKGQVAAQIKKQMQSAGKSVSRTVFGKKPVRKLNQHTYNVQRGIESTGCLPISLLW